MQWTPAKTGDLHTLTTVDLISPAFPSVQTTPGSPRQATSRPVPQMLEPDTPIPNSDLLQRAYAYLKKRAFRAGGPPL